MLRVPTLSFTPEERLDTLRTIHDLRVRLGTVRRQLESQPEAGDLLDQEDELVLDLWIQRQLYSDGVPVIDISRCPFTGVRLSYPIDTDGLDGPWWDYEDPLRPAFSPPPSAYAITGAVELADELESAPFVASPGPGRPYVIPRLLEAENSVAVLSSIPIGPHRGFAIVYFGFPAAPERPVVNEWASDRCFFTGMRGEPSWDSRPLGAEQLDFRLKPWLEQDRLLWIAPGDGDLAVQRGPDGCPYLNVTGPPDLQWIFEGMLQ
jgi:hypothetical protein